MNAVTLTFYLDEEVTPEIFVQRVALACAKSNTLRVGESVGVIGSSQKWESHGVIPLDLWGNGQTFDYPHIKQVEA